jgi:serine/threonine-protein kinase
VFEDWPTETDATLPEFLTARGWSVVRNFGERRDSRAAVLGIESTDGERFVVKHAEDWEAIAWLESAHRFHAAVKHPAIPTIVRSIGTATGFGIVEEWGQGEILSDGYDATVLPPDHDGSAYRRFLRLPVEKIVDAVDQLIAVHVAVADAGYVAVDLYDGCILYDFSAHIVRLVDLDHYRPGPYVLQVDRQIGSSSYMAPEEFRRGATIDERAVVHTLGRMALVYLGCARKTDAFREDFRGTDGQFGVAMRACAADPADRIQSVRDLHLAWSRHSPA